MFKVLLIFQVGKIVVELIWKMIVISMYVVIVRLNRKNILCFFVWNIVRNVI